MNLHCTHLWLTRYRSNLLGHDCSWLIINFTMRLLMSLPIFLFYNQKICPVIYNFVQTKSQNVQKMANCWVLFWALGQASIYSLIHLFTHSSVVIEEWQSWHILTGLSKPILGNEDSWSEHLPQIALPHLRQWC